MMVWKQVSLTLTDCPNRCEFQPENGIRGYTIILSRIILALYSIWLKQQPYFTLAVLRR